LATLVVNAGRAVITSRLAGMSTWIGWGTGAGTTAAADTTLFTEDSAGSPAYARQATTSTQQTTTTTNDTHQMVATITSNGAKTITNAGVFDAVTTGNLYVKGDFTGIGLALNDSVTFTVRVAFA
jgi:hypothetical protein